MANVDLLSHIVASLKTVQTIVDAMEVVKLGKAQLTSAMADPRTASCRVSGGRPLAAVLAPFVPGNSRVAVAKDIRRLLHDAEAELQTAKSQTQAVNA